MRVRHSPSAVRNNWPVGRWVAGLSATIVMLVSAIALTVASSGAA